MYYGNHGEYTLSSIKVRRPIQKNRLTSQKLEYSELKADNDAYYSEVLSSVDLETIRKKALDEFGMKHATEDQIKYYTPDGDGYVRRIRKYRKSKSEGRAGGSLKRQQKKGTKRLTKKMKTKLVGLLIVILLALVALIFRITYISIKSGDRYTRQVLTQSQQQYESTTVPFKRGDILDRNGNTLATSVKVYNVILDCSLVNFR